MTKVDRDQLMKSSNGLKGKEINDWLSTAVPYIRGEGSLDFDIISKATFLLLFLGDTEQVDDFLLAQNPKYESYLSKACGPRMKQVVLNDAIAFGRLQALKKPVKIKNLEHGFNLMLNCCTRTPSVDVVIESINILRNTFELELKSEDYDLFVDAVKSISSMDQDAGNNLKTNIGFGLFYAWTNNERFLFLERIGDIRRA